MPLVRSSLLPVTSAMLAESPPSNDSALPNLPPATRVGAAAPAASVPFIGAADESVTAPPDTSSKPSARTRPPLGGVTTAPVDTTSATALPGAAFVPPAGFWLMTLPDATVVLLAVVTAPTVRPAPVIEE